jgi:hypothetical protein
MKMPEKYRVWVDARKRHHLSHAHVQMARELGMNPAKLGKIDNHKQEPWKVPLGEFIQNCYEDSFKRPQPDTILSIEAMVKLQAKKKEEKRARKLSPPVSEIDASEWI